MHMISPIGTIHTPYKEKFAIPRQPNLAPTVTTELHLIGDANNEACVRELKQFSHVWLLFLFDKNIDAGWKPTVRPPRLGGNERIGVFASRATFRPNAIGMSAVQLLDVQQKNNQVILKLGNVDLVDGTPIIDIKPYIPYADSIPDAIGGYADAPPTAVTVVFSKLAESVLQAHPEYQYRQQALIEILAQDPRPAYKKNKPDSKVYTVSLFEWDVQFSAKDNSITVLNIAPLAQSN
ncbi:tRNA-Thr(GGU) m(6)t(6)A37 methyltransferase TsaA [Vibrio sp. UCD-FRSSP16_10]|uniref:tRNA (N6-threonylcarbamoyladenosine(37)-N6)-methyltransferase TrmO n=1 Tax=unclassified Vibrio TaxID=2614977 RepID=UPI0007FEAAB8|nr:MULTISPECIES: tRNA (N6-threonylcarbamoyladenosine(37)-N6)-methyltransferase TrmO [unclassified Vibrio]OBT06535.1 tRNA-Thr(GGU) m(6)t(6)A37 methyltransferase TsaA [Vibrio sp. UCD-FRSSP16_30]OBT12232.1 tRNA-Thr(GGU) m(6)t(6)A37 methyltransferase TsaA [Vibrio sp. UCD-FRSSP16_10]